MATCLMAQELSDGNYRITLPGSPKLVVDPIYNPLPT